MTRYVPRAVLAATVVLLVVATVLTLLRHSSRVLSTNGVAPAAFVVSVPAGERACQAVPPAPAATLAIRLTVGVYSDPRARLRADAGWARDGRVVRGRDGLMELPIANAAYANRICIANVGDRKVELAGVAAGPEAAAIVDDEPADGAFGVQFLRGPADSWGERVGDVLARVGYATGLPVGSVTGALTIALLVTTLGGALALSWKALRP